ncbi:hypothetical protein SCUCBS95973_006285 [Sporothrix curviconia]|uniref:SET domain-containing protein n=1 Tax=Sporothrix curviconia TaxID=1260050 RepID=A0ABP0C609_9PEZI
MPLIDRLRLAGYLDSDSEDDGPTLAKNVKKGKSKSKGKDKKGAEAAAGKSSTLSSKKSETKIEAADDGDDGDDEDEDSSGTGSDACSTDKDTSDDEVKAGHTASETKEAAQDAESETELKAKETTDSSSATSDTTPPASPYPDYHLSDHDNGYGSGGSDMSEIQIRADEKVRRVVSNSHGYFNVLGRADCLQQRSAGTLPPPPVYYEKITLDRFGRVVRERRKRQPQQQQDKSEYSIVELTYPTGDDNAVDGFHIWGFKDGKRVYRLESEFLQLFQTQRVKTSVGFCYIDLAAVCPPKVVTVPADESTARADPPTSITDPSTETSANTFGVTPAMDQFCDSTAASTIDSGLHTDMSINTTANASPAADASLPPSLHPTLEVNDTFAIRPSALGGMGCFALRNICRGDHVLVERPLLRTNLLHLFHELEYLSPAQRAQYDALHAWHPDPRASRKEQIWTANTFVAGELEGLFVVASRFNHACSGSPKQNVGYRYDRQQNVLVLTATARIAAGAELLISYGKSRQMLQDRFGFMCECGSCDATGGESSTKLLTAEELYKRMWS